MKRTKAYALLAVCFASGAVASQKAQAPVPAATFSQFECSGFISSSRLSSHVQVFNGADNDLYESLHAFATGDYVYLRRNDHRRFYTGEAYSTLRPENGFGLNPAWLPGMIQNQILPPASWYPHQRYDIEKLGWPYDNTGLVQVVRVTPQGAVAKVIFACNGIYPQDIAVPYRAEPVPSYIPGVHLGRFAEPNGKLEGTIVADANATAYLARGSIAFLNVGKKQGVEPGQRYRVFAVFRDNIAMGLQGLFGYPKTPRETVGEVVILHVRQKSAVGIVVSSLRQISVGDGVELE